MEFAGIATPTWIDGTKKEPVKALTNMGYGRSFSIKKLLYW
jgi:hypothetical protein